VSPELKQFLLDRSLGNTTIALDPMCEELFLMYMEDVNSSSLREIITILVAGYDPIPGKLGRDAIDRLTGASKEAKPKSYTGTSTNGSGCFNDYTRERYNKDIQENLDIVHSLFIGDRLAYVIEFNILAIKSQLDKKIQIHCEQNKQRYVRTASWSYLDWVHHPSVKFHYIDWKLIDANKGCINRNMYKALRGTSLMEFLV